MNIINASISIPNPKAALARVSRLNVARPGSTTTTSLGMVPTSMTGTIRLLTVIPNRCNLTTSAVTMKANPRCLAYFATSRVATRRFMSLIAGHRPTA